MMAVRMNKSSLWLLVALLATSAGIRAQAPTGARPNVKDAPRIVCFGDSLTAGFGLDSGQSYPDLLQQQLDRQGYRYHVINLGISGDTTQDGLARLAMVVAEHPRIVVLEFGANDGLRGLPVSVAQNNQARMIETLRKAGSQLVLAGMTLPPNYGPDYVTRFTAMYPDLAKKYQLPLIPFLLAGVATKPDLMQADGLHPNAAGTKLVAENVMRALQPLLRR